MMGAKDVGAEDKPNDKQTAFEKLRDFARRIVSVPKAEIDEQARTYNRKRKRKRLSG